MIDLNHKPKLSEILSGQIDKALVEHKNKEPKRSYLGASRLGESCERALQFEYFHCQKDDGKDFDGQTYRIFDRGFWGEDYILNLLKLAGYEVKTRDANDKQFGFSILNGKVSGHCDGVIVSGPDSLKYPALFENKIVGEKSWKKFVAEGVRKANPTYYGQILLYQAYLDLAENSALFCAINANTMELFFESVPFDPQVAQALSDRAVLVIRSCDDGVLLPRISSDPSFYVCKFCSWHEHCFSLKN